MILLKCLGGNLITQLKQKDIAPLRDKLLKEQNHRCPICGKIIIHPVLDHHHKKRIKGTGQIRAVLCSPCNIFLAKCENNCVRYGISQQQLPRVLRRIIRYLKADQLPYLHPSEKEKEPKLMKISYNKLRKEYNGRAKFPEYPKSGKLTVKLKALFEQYEIEPKFYSK